MAARAHNPGPHQLKDIVFEKGDYFILKVRTGFEVYKQGITHSERVARIGYLGNKGLERAKLEIEKRTNPAISPEQYRLAQAVLSGGARTGHMSVEAAREIVDRTPARLRSEYSRYTTNPAGGEVELGGGKHFLPLSTKEAAKKMARLLQAEGAKAEVTKRDGQWGVIHQHANPIYGMDLDLETTMAPAWMYYESKAARDAAARLYEGEGKKVVLEHSMFGFGEGGGKKWRLRGVSHRGNPVHPDDVPHFTDASYVAGKEQGDKDNFARLRRGRDSFLYAFKQYVGTLRKRGLVKGKIQSDIEQRMLKAFEDGYRTTRLEERQNPQPAADDMYESFHGEPTDETIEFQNEEHYHSHLAALGELVELKVKLVNGGTAVIGFDSVGEEETVENPKKGMVKILGHTVKISSKKHEILLAQKKHYDDLQQSEQGRGRKDNPFWPFNSFTHSTIYHVGTGEKYKKAGSHKGYTLYQKLDTGEFLVPALDKDSRFDTGKDAEAFVDSWTKHAKNPGPFHGAGQLIGKGRRAIRKPMDDFLGIAGKMGGYLDDELGRVINPESHDTGPAYLTSNEDGTQVFITGGDQSLDLPGLGITGHQAEKELVTIGQVTNVVYHAHKIFDGKREEYDYTHKLSEDSIKTKQGKKGLLPILIYDRLNKSLKLSGGVYHIPRPFAGTSQGITD